MKNESRLSLSQVLAIERQQNRLFSIVPSIKGWVQATLREIPLCDRCQTRMRHVPNGIFSYVCDECGNAHNNRGTIVKQVAQENVILPGWAVYRLVNVAMSPINVLVSNDDQPAHPRKDMWINTYANKGASYEYVTVSPTIDYANKIWTILGTFTNPSAPGRYVRWVGIQRNSGYGIIWSAYTYAGYGEPSISGTKLTSEIYQTNLNTLEILYKYVFSEAV